MSTYRERPVFEWPIDWSALPAGRIEYDLTEIALGFGAEAFYGDQEHAVQGWRFQVVLDTPEAIDTFDAFTAALQGRLIGFWLPTPVAAFRIVAGGTAGQCDIAAEGLAETWEDHPAVFVWFTKAGQTSKGVRIVGVTDNGDGTERVTFEETVSVDATWQAWVLAYVRLAEDTEKAEFTAEGRETRLVQVIELPAEYAALETGSQPVFFYHFWMGEDANRADWHWTSFAWDLDVGELTFLTKRITHGAIQYDTTGVRHGVEIEVERTADSPFALTFPPHGCQPLHVEIATADYADVSAPTVLFTGIVTSVQAEGRKLKARCVTLWGGEQTRVPAFYFSARCQYRVFDPATCGLDRALWEKTATMSAVNARSVTVTGVSLYGVLANGFAEGWIEVGTGAQREVRLILANAQENAGAVTLTLNAPLRFNTAGATVTLIPGCDGRWVTCDSKFSNTANYGGHRFALRNLAIKALDIPQIHGGKK